MTNVRIVFKWSWHWCRRRKVFPWPTRYVLEIPEIPQHWRNFCIVSKNSMGNSAAPGLWIAAFQPRRCWKRCVIGVSALHPTGLPNGKQPRPNNLSFVAADTITYFSCLHRRTNRTFGEVIGGFNPLVRKKDKKMLPLPIFTRTSFSGVGRKTLRLPVKAHSGCFPRRRASPEVAVVSRR